MTVISPSAVLDHHHDAAKMWGAGGRSYDDISFAISDALAHAAQRLNAKPDERILDVATGTGWSARNVARAGAYVTGVDIAPELLAAAEELSWQCPVEYQLADAERLPFRKACFDKVISTFGVMFAVDHAQAAGELARVCRPGGRLVIAAWVPDGAVAKFFGILAGYSEAPPPKMSPLAWGDPEHVNRLLGDAFELTFEPGVSHAYHDDEDDVWAWYARGFGPIRSLLPGLSQEQRGSLRRDVNAYHAHYRTQAGLNIAREYLLTVGRRR